MPCLNFARVIGVVAPEPAGLQVAERVKAGYVQVARTSRLRSSSRRIINIWQNSQREEPMSFEGLQAVIGRAVVDQSFRNGLLEDPSSAIDAFELTETEFKAIATIRADDLQQFATKLHWWITQNALQGERYEPIVQRDYETCCLQLPSNTISPMSLRGRGLGQRSA